MSEPTKKCARTDCGADLAGVERWDCICGCGKSWCASCGWSRKRIEFPGDKSYLVRVVPAPSAPLIPQSRAEEMVAEERKAFIERIQTWMHDIKPDCEPWLTLNGLAAAVRLDIDQKTEATNP
jgi:hypothetical protein